MSGKLKITKLAGTGEAIGEMFPQTGMVTDEGPILSIPSGNLTVIVGRGSGDFKAAMPTDLLIVTQTEASGHRRAGDGFVSFGRVAMGVAANSGVVVIGPTGPYTYYR